MLLAIVACDTEPEFRDADAVPLVDEDQAPTGGDRFVPYNEELQAEKFDPDALYVTVEGPLGKAVAARAKQLTNGYAGVENRKSHAAAVQRLVRDSLEADVVVLAQVVERTQENRVGYDGELVPWTVYELSVGEVVRGNYDVTNPLRFERLGGTIDDTTVRACGGPEFALDRTYFVALAESGDKKQGFLWNDESAWLVEDGVLAGVGLAVAPVKSMLEVAP